MDLDSQKMEAFWSLVNAHLDVGGSGNTVSNVPLGNGYTLVVTGGLMCDSHPNTENLDSLEEFTHLQITLHDPSWKIVGVEEYPELEKYSDVIYEKYPNTHIGSFVPIKDIADMLLNIDILEVPRVRH